MDSTAIAGAESFSASLLLPLTITCTALAVGRLARVLIGFALRDSPAPCETWECDTSRRARLREAHILYRLCEPLIDDLAGWATLMRMVPILRLQRNLDAGAGKLPWTASEFAATKMIEGLLLAMLLAWLLGGMFSLPTCAVIGCLTLMVYPQWACIKLNAQARVRLEAIQRRLPYGIDLMALMMQAGAGFRDSLAAVAAESGDHPLGQELRKVHLAAEHGQPLRQALIELRDRLHQDDVGELVFSILKAQELGTPLSTIFLALAEQMRLKRFQWAEKKAAQAETRMESPVLLLLIGSLIIAVGPFVLLAAKGHLP